MGAYRDGPHSRRFTPVRFSGNKTFGDLARGACSPVLKENIAYAPSGDCVGWGVPFAIGDVLAARDSAVSAEWPRVKSRWLVFMHTTDIEPIEWNRDGLLTASREYGRLAEHVADYVFRYADGSETVCAIRRRHHIGMLSRPCWGENCFQSVVHHKAMPVRPPHEQQPPMPPWVGWGQAQTRVAGCYNFRWINWLWAWENPHPEKAIAGLRIEPRSGLTIVSAISAGNVASNPLRWETRRKAILALPKGKAFDPRLNEDGVLPQIQLDLGQVISAQPRRIYPNDAWADGHNNQMPKISDREILVEYTAHPEAEFHLPGGKRIPVSRLAGAKAAGALTPVASATQRVQIRIVDASSKKPVAVKLHVHGEAGEYLAPTDRHRIPNDAWFEDYSVDYVNQGAHACAYAPGETVVALPLGRVYIEASKGFEIAPVRKVFTVTRGTRTITIPLRKVLPWRERGWVTADTHVHFLSPMSARLEGAAEGVNVVNLLASQWGELMTNVGDFDGATTWGSRETGGDGEYLVRVGTENRQYVLGHISLLGYNGPIIAPMTTGGPEESAFGDPVGALLTEWARQCRKQGGIVVLPHFPSPRAEHAAAVVDGSIDAIEMTSWGNLYGGIDPYSLSDWYRYLNCGYMVAAVAGTDKMSANTAVGAVRTYARIPDERPFDYQAWMDAVRAGRTFVTYGPLIEFHVEGKPSGSRIRMKRNGGTVDVVWEAASVTVPMSRADLIVNGEIRESRALRKWNDAGHWSVRVDRSSWIALLVRGHYPDRPEIVAAHSSPIMVEVEGSPFFAAADAVTILDQIEGALAYLDTTGTRADDAAYKRMRLILTSAHRELHNRLHACGQYHEHTPVTDHKEHH